MSEARSGKRSREGRFEGKVIVITGAGGTFGQVGSVMFAEEGAKVVAVDMAPTGNSHTHIVPTSIVPSNATYLNAIYLSTRGSTTY